MIQIATVFILLHLILCQDILNISFKEENKTCDGKSEWTHVKYEEIEVSSFHESLTALRANNESCSSFPILLEPGSTLELIVYVKTTRVNSGIVIAVYLDESGLTARCILIRTYESGEEGWRKITLQIEKGGVGHINLRGYSQDDEMVLIDSIRYKLNTTTVDDQQTNKELIIIEENEYDLQEEIYSADLREKKTNSDFSEGELNASSSLEDVTFRDENDSGALGPWAITLISLGCVTVTALVVVSAYHLGKIMGPAKDPPVVFDAEPPRVEIIPRVRGTVDYFEDTIQNFV